MTETERANARLVDHRSATVSPLLLVTRLGRWAQGEGTLAERLAHGIASLVRSGELRAGDRLPAERALAAAVSVSRGTVVAAYGILSENGVVERRQGSGTVVAGTLLRLSGSGTAHRGEALFSALPSSIDLLRSVPQMPDLAVGIVRAHDPEPDLVLLSETDPAGLPVLRERIARRFAAEGTPTTLEQILVTHGAQSAFHLLVGEVVSPGDVVLTEEVTWPGFSDAVRRRGGILQGIPMGPDGIDVMMLEEAMARLRPVLVAINPHHHNPTGLRLPSSDRLRIAELAAEYGVPVLEDRVLAPISFDGVVPPTLAALRPDAPILVTDSVSKWAWSGLRIGWLRADPVLVRRLRGARQIVDMFTSVPAQLLALDFLDRADELRREVSERHAGRLELLRGLLAEHLPEWEYRPPRGGLSLWARLPSGSAEEVIARAAMRGVAVAGSDAFAATASNDDHIRLPFTAPDSSLEEGLRRLGEAWRELG
ncbi:PLP-dependent aminotransferase family protein [Leucobacter weissii]|uniref:PLP-dependent aminotransferase family protein n=1 Tax=Leucobacter weissii TaxID=1983706 RepID=A0A939SCZ7_9MICO|nr:PLP-dependent aminotransferase family protein [Leucobacter weissii]MBO1902863.1 PLP-dependent aminotransferase family protein [Leucobacter weissii]